MIKRFLAWLDRRAYPVPADNDDYVTYLRGTR